VHAIEAYGGAELQFHAFLFLALDGESVHIRPLPLHPWE